MHVFWKQWVLVGQTRSLQVGFENVYSIEMDLVLLELEFAPLSHKLLEILSKQGPTKAGTRRTVAGGPSIQLRIELRVRPEDMVTVRSGQLRIFGWHGPSR